MDVTREQLARALDGVTVWCKPERGQNPADTFAGTINNPESVARQVLGKIGADTEPDDVVEAHICCEHADTDPELAAMAALLPAVPLLQRLGYDARTRVIEWYSRRVNDGQASF